MVCGLIATKLQILSPAASRWEDLSCSPYFFIHFRNCSKLLALAVILCHSLRVSIFSSLLTWQRIFSGISPRSSSRSRILPWYTIDCICFLQRMVSADLLISLAAKRLLDNVELVRDLRNGKIKLECLSVFLFIKM